MLRTILEAQFPLFVGEKKKTTLSSGTANNARVNAFFVICTTDQQFERRFTSHAFMVLPLQPACAQFTDSQINRELYFRLCCVFVVWSMAGEADDFCTIESTSWPATYLLSTLDAQMLMICTQEHLILFFGVSFSLWCITRSLFGIVGDVSVETDRTILAAHCFNFQSVRWLQNEARTSNKNEKSGAKKKNSTDSNRNAICVFCIGNFHE